jgi:hypothetical protein
MIRLALVTPAIIVVAVTVVGAILAVAVIDAVTSKPPPEQQAVAMLDVAPGGIILPVDLPDAFAALYRVVEDRPELFAEIPCFCGCQAMLDHRHLLDCFVRPDGSGWEAHAAGCGVCIGEAQQVAALLDAGETDPDAIRTAVIAEWSDPYTDKEST